VDRFPPDRYTEGKDVVRMATNDPEQRTIHLSVTIPTKNSAATIESCITSVLEQAVPVEVIVADDRSSDGTQNIARLLGARVLSGPLPLLEARYQAMKAAQSNVVLLLDSDQTMMDGSLSRCLQMLETNDVLILEESSEEATTWVGKLYEADKRYLHAHSKHHMDPIKGSLLPRVFKKSVLEAAFEKIPQPIRMTAVAQDHAIIYAEVARISDSIGMVPRAVSHKEMEHLGELWRKYWRWGTGLADLFRIEPEYRALTNKKMKGRLHRGSASTADFLKSLVLMGIKAVPYSAGYAFANLRQRIGPDRERPGGTRDVDKRAV
jgi:glycosyltransferase involved in cell wall biosynthesis